MNDFQINRYNNNRKNYPKTNEELNKLFDEIQSFCTINLPYQLTGLDDLFKKSTTTKVSKTNVIDLLNFKFLKLFLKRCKNVQKNANINSGKRKGRTKKNIENDDEYLAERLLNLMNDQNEPNDKEECLNQKQNVNEIENFQSTNSRIKQNNLNSIKSDQLNQDSQTDNNRRRYPKTNKEFDIMFNEIRNYCSINLPFRIVGLNENEKYNDNVGDETNNSQSTLTRTETHDFNSIKSNQSNSQTDVNDSKREYPKTNKEFDILFNEIKNYCSINLPFRIVGLNEKEQSNNDNNVDIIANDETEYFQSTDNHNAKLNDSNPIESDQLNQSNSETDDNNNNNVDKTPKISLTRAKEMFLKDYCPINNHLKSTLNYWQANFQNVQLEKSKSKTKRSTKTVMIVRKRRRKRKTRTKMVESNTKKDKEEMEENCRKSKRISARRSSNKIICPIDSGYESIDSSTSSSCIDSEKQYENDDITVKWNAKSLLNCPTPKHDHFNDTPPMSPINEFF